MQPLRSMAPLRLEGFPCFSHSMGVKLSRGRASIPVRHPFPQPYHGLDVLLDHRNPVGSWKDSGQQGPGTDTPSPVHPCTSWEHSGLGMVTLTWSAGLRVPYGRYIVPVDENQLWPTVLVPPMALVLFHGRL